MVRVVAGEEVLVGWVGGPVEDREAYPGAVRVVGRVATSVAGRQVDLLAAVVGASSWVANRVADLCDHYEGTVHYTVTIATLRLHLQIWLDFKHVPPILKYLSTICIQYVVFPEKYCPNLDLINNRA